MTKYEILLTAPEFDMPVRYVVHYLDPEPIEAESEEEARKIVQQMIDDGEFTNTGDCQPDPSDDSDWNDYDIPEPEIDVVRINHD